MCLLSHSILTVTISKLLPNVDPTLIMYHFFQELEKLQSMQICERIIITFIFRNDTVNNHN